MTLRFHPAVRTGLVSALSYYETVGGADLANRFETEFRRCLAAIRAAPERFARYPGSRTFWRIRLRQFPFVIVYRIGARTIRIVVLKHKSRSPLHGMDRE